MTTQAPSTTKLPDDLVAVKHKLEQLAAEGRVDALIALVVDLLARMRDSHNALATRLAAALRELYGKRSQKVSQEQVSSLLAALGDDAPASATAAKDGAPPSPPPASSSGEGNIPQPPESPKPPKSRDRGGRSPLPEHLPRRERKVPVAEQERVCPHCGGPRVCIGYRTSEILELIAAHFEIIEEKREKVACPRCPEEGVATAPSEKVMDRGRPGPALLANILVEKFDDAMPLYRQSQQYERGGVWLSPSTLGDWNAYGIDVLAPIADRIRERVFGSSYVRADDTGMRVLDRDHPKGIKLGHIWAFVGTEWRGEERNELIAFDYAPNWKSDHPAKRLQGFRGDLQGDGYAGYGAMLRDGTEEPLVPEERRLGCGMHIRAKFEKAAKGNDARAAVALAYFKAIYRVEASCKAEGLSPEARKARRDEQSMPQVDELYRWIHEIHPRLLPNTPLFVATQYAIHQEAAWRRCFADGRFEIDNGEVERRIRKVALGRKNYLFAGSDKGAERLATAYTVFGSCHMHGVNTLAWATDVIQKLQDGWPKARIDELLPDAWVKIAAAAHEAA